MDKHSSNYPGSYLSSLLAFQHNSALVGMTVFLSIDEKLLRDSLLPSALKGILTVKLFILKVLVVDGGSPVQGKSFSGGLLQDGCEKWRLKVEITGV